MNAQYDKFEQLVFDAELAVAIFSNPATSDFELINLAPGQHRPHDLRERGMCFVGVMGIVKGVPRTALDAPLDATITAALSQAFVRHIEQEANRELELAGLGRLYQLPDPRSN